MNKAIIKVIWFLYIGLILTSRLYGQQRFLNNQRMWNDMMFNPAKIVETHGFSIYANHRQQYYSLGAQSPYLFIIGGKANLTTHYSQNMLYSQQKYKRNLNIALGGYYTNSFTGGVFDQNEICGQFGLQLKLNQKLVNPTDFDQLNFGISVKGLNNRYRGNSIFNLYDQNDPQFTGEQVTNKFAFSVMPGIQYINKSIALDAVFTFGPTDQQFGSITIMGSQKLDNFFNRLAFRVNYFGNPNCQIALNKIQELSNNKWEFIYIATNQDVKKVGHSMGISTCITYSESNASILKVIDACNIAIAHSVYKLTGISNSLSHEQIPTDVSDILNSLQNCKI